MSDNNAPQAPVEEERPDRTRTLVAFGALTVAALGAGAFFFLGGSEAEEPVAAAAPAAAAPIAPPVAAEAVPVAATLPTPTDLPIGRNPFKVPGIYIPPVVEAPAEGTGTGTGTGVVVGVGNGTGGTGTGGTGTGGGGSTAPQPPGEKHKLILLRVFGEGPDLSAVFSIHDGEQTAKVGSVFGPTAQILLIELTEGPAGVWTATLQVGDGDPFDVVIGEPAYVR